MVYGTYTQMIARKTLEIFTYLEDLVFSICPFKKNNSTAGCRRAVLDA